METKLLQLPLAELCLKGFMDYFKTQEAYLTWLTLMKFNKN